MGTVSSFSGDRAFQLSFSLPCRILCHKIGRKVHTFLSVRNVKGNHSAGASTSRSTNPSPPCRSRTVRARPPERQADRPWRRVGESSTWRRRRTSSHLERGPVGCEFVRG